MVIEATHLGHFYVFFTSKNGHFTQQQWQFTVDLREQTWFYEASPRYIYHKLK